MKVMQHSKTKTSLFKVISLGCLLFAACFTPSLSHAWWRACGEPEMESCCPDDFYAGLGYKHLWAKPTPNWRPILVKTHPGFLGYFGWRFFPEWSVEVGYEWSTNKPTAFNVVNGSSLLNLTNTTGTNVIVEGKVRFKTGYLDLNYYWPISFWENCNFSPELIFSLGVSSTRAKLNIDIEPVAVRTTDFGVNFLDTDSKARTLLRVGAGLQVMLTDKIGFKGMWRFENTNALRAKRGLANIHGNEKIFRNAQSVALSLFLTFKSF